jgi:hypothetical protein
MPVSGLMGDMPTDASEDCNGRMHSFPRTHAPELTLG